MTEHMANAVRRTPLYGVIARFRQIREMRNWDRVGRPVPTPHLLKQRTIRAYARRFGTRTLVETGTYMGDMVAALQNAFAQIISIELSDELYRRARKRFARAPHVQILHGDSARVLPEVLHSLATPTLFWLDGHYSSGITARGALETPVMDELRHICDHDVQDHVVMIDDAHLFVGQNDYPTVQELRAFVTARRPTWMVECVNNILVLHGAEPGGHE